MLHTPASRWTAAASHLLLSVLLIGTIALVAFLQWFPAGLHHAAKLDRLLAIMLGVDVVAGPVLTLILYRRGKRGLMLDLTVVALLQVAFLAYGLSTLWHSRPLFLVGSDQAFALIFANEVAEDADAAAKNKGWRRFHGSGPWLVGVDLSSPVAKDEFLFAYMSGDPGPLRDPDLFLVYAKVRSQIRDAGRPLTPDVPAPSVDRANTRYVALMSARSRDSVMLLDASTGTPLRVVATEARKSAADEAKKD